MLNCTEAAFGAGPTKAGTVTTILVKADSGKPKVARTPSMVMLVMGGRKLMPVRVREIPPEAKPPRGERALIAGKTP